jgi:predicted transcriptional regulator
MRLSTERNYEPTKKRGRSTRADDRQPTCFFRSSAFLDPYIHVLLADFCHRLIIQLNNILNESLIKNRKEILLIIMRQKKVMYFTEKEVEFVDLLIEVGTNKNVAKVLVFLANTPRATSREIERGIDLRQPEVSIALRLLLEQNWIRCSKSKAEGIGRPVKRYELARSIHEILDCIENKKKIDVSKKLAVIQKLREHSG